MENFNVSGVAGTPNAGRSTEVQKQQKEQKMGAIPMTSGNGQSQQVDNKPQGYNVYGEDIANFANFKGNDQHDAIRMTNSAANEVRQAYLQLQHEFPDVVIQFEPMPDPRKCGKKREGFFTYQQKLEQWKGIAMTQISNAREKCIQELQDEPKKTEDVKPADGAKEPDKTDESKKPDGTRADDTKVPDKTDGAKKPQQTTNEPGIATTPHKSAQDSETPTTEVNQNGTRTDGVKEPDKTDESKNPDGTRADDTKEPESTPAKPPKKEEPGLVEDVLDAAVAGVGGLITKIPEAIEKIRDRISENNQN